MQTQMDLFGNEVPVEQAYAKTPRETIKSRWRLMYGYRQDEFCGHCKYCQSFLARRRIYKCVLMGVSNSEATDIRLKDPACSRFEDYI